MNGRPWSSKELRQLESLYPMRSTVAVAAILNRSVSSTYNTAYQLGLRKAPEFFESEESGWLKKGQTRPEMVATQFSKGPRSG